MKVLILLALIVLSNSSFSQTDSLVFRNGNFIVGEIKSMDRGVVFIETDYSDKDFNIDWEGVRRIYSDTYFFIGLSNDVAHHGTIRSISDSLVVIISENDQATEYAINDIVFLEPINKSFRKRFDASIDIGFTLTKANDLRQLTTSGMAGYKGDKWNSQANFDILRSTQIKADTIKRIEAGIVFRYLFFKKWYISGSTAMLSNTEQKLDLRNNSKIGFGKYFIHSNQVHLNVLLGANRNLERFSNETSDRESWEIYFGTNLDVFDLGDFSLLSNILAYSSITAPGRWRLDGNLNGKYDLPLDFYIKAGISLNYDNKPAQDASKTDYVFQTGFGWEW